MTAGDHRDADRVGFAQAYPAVPESVSAIRRALARFASESGAPSRVGDAAALAVSEAATNVVVHAYRESAEQGRIEVTGALTSDELLVTVSDTGIGLRPYPDSPGLGLGLAIIAQTVDRVELLRPHTGGFELRMHFALRTAPP